MPSEPLILVYVYSCILAVGELTSLGSVYSSQDKYRPASSGEPPPTGGQHAELGGRERRTNTGECFTDIWPPHLTFKFFLLGEKNHDKIGSWSLRERAPRHWISHVAFSTHVLKVSWFSKHLTGKVCGWPDIHDHWKVWTILETLPQNIANTLNFLIYKNGFTQNKP